MSTRLVLIVSVYELFRRIHITQVRLRELINGGAPRNRDARYVQVDQRITAAKAVLAQRWNMLPVNARVQELAWECDQYLQHLIHLLG